MSRQPRRDLGGQKRIAGALRNRPVELIGFRERQRLATNTPKGTPTAPGP